MKDKKTVIKTIDGKRINKAKTMENVYFKRL